MLSIGNKVCNVESSARRPRMVIIASTPTRYVRVFIRLSDWIQTANLLGSLFTSFDLSY